ncbi:TPA: TonB system transport protein ExbD [Mannheimia haemolytica]|uniref:Biopolymer transport protein ExbD n=2 Tax=Mannheimia haemolytica TaxID=75985 RepID=EXBD_MANHA|nr:TonB system transport protein ExbD [Mannheimia haemolytica]P72203.1 RecName: Full=Biopolymer transport protein ExbD [Mannheimia haemolytica]AWW70875.1 biopolymer transporter ExbD [Pasteurellaceae bacterium 12565]AAB09529.1 ExbD [Mannheimia haemolytica]ABG89167.1 biopolymer transport protein [Mannheimia haemolytica]AGI31966.1 biopolymer transporter ExbD [Mannheimia haemolytica USDA-ARS-USMARC-183]AGI35924.1 biopolymer transporter ExbD [Mannheimia haemolytica USDA-ARS-USMARC-185]
MKKFDEINIIPFIDIMLVLLAIVLVTASFISQGKIQVNVPKASTTQPMKADDLAKLLTITENNEFFFNDQAITKEQLIAEVATWDKSQKVSLKVDGAVAFEKFVELTDILSANEIKNVAIITKKETAPAPSSTPGSPAQVPAVAP